MKKTIKKVAAFALSAILLCCVSAFVGCCNDNTRNVIETDDTYTVSPFVHIGGAMDEEITIDGIMDEPFYEGRHWMIAHKTGNASATVSTTTYFGKNGLLIAGKVVDDVGVYYNSQRALGQNSYIEYFFTNGNTKTWAEGFFEMIVDVGMNTRMFEHRDGWHSYLAGWDEENEPSYALHFEGEEFNFTDGSVHEYSVETYFPYELLGWDSAPETVYVTPVLLTSLSADGSQTEQWLIANKLSFYGWDKSKMFTFDENGFADNTLTIYPTKGGTVAEEHGDDYCVTGDEVIVYVTPDAGNELDTFLVNGVSMADKIEWLNGVGTYKFTCQGDVAISATFAAA